MYFFTSFLDGSAQFDSLREYEREEDADLVGSGWIEVRVRGINHGSGLIYIENDGRRYVNSDDVIVGEPHRRQGPRFNIKAGDFLWYNKRLLLSNLYRHYPYVEIQQLPADFPPVDERYLRISDPY